jgi:colicin import membrane protein
MAQPRPSLRSGLYPSAALHLLLLTLLVIWGDRVPVPEPPRQIDIVMIEVPKGPSEDLGLGTLDDPGEEIPDQAAIPEVSQSAKEKLSDLLERLEEPDVKPKPTPETIAPPVTAPKKPPKATAKKNKAQPKRKKKNAGDKLLSSLEKATKQPGARGKDSPGWKGGTGAKPLTTIPPSAILGRYRAQVRARILRQWSKPAQLTALPPSKRPRAVVHVRINGSGSVTGKRWIKRSGNEYLDTSAMRAIARAAPLPAPPKEVASLAVSQGFNITFKP